MHPSIASPAPGLVVPTAPAIAAPDGVWNHGEGFGANAIDSGGWHGNTDGTNLTAADVHVSVDPITTNPWVAYTWQSDPDNLHPLTGHQMLRMEGWLRPAGNALPTVHPMYGALGQSYVDQGAFEMFKPITGWTPGQRILVGDELIAGTLSGDIIVYDADTLVERWRTHVHGSAGCFNSIRAEDLDGDGLKELYVAGSFGLWRFTQPGESP